MAHPKPDYSVIIAGCGFSGLNMLIQLKRTLGITDVMVFEKSNEVGGTWNYNRYPGAACDIPMMFYSYSFNHMYWDEPWAPQPVILKYIKDTVSKFKVANQIQFGTSILKAEWLDSSSLWRITLQNHRTDQTFVRHAKVFISAVGVFSIPNELKVEGVERFKGRIVHTGKYDTSLDVKDKNVVVLGNGCSGTQVVPAIAPKVKSLTQFGRAKHWYIPRPDLPEGRTGILHWLFKHSRVARRVQRWLVFVLVEFGFLMMDQKRGQWVRNKQADMSREYIRETAPKSLQEWFIPDFEVGQKRRIFDKEYTGCLDQERISFYPENVKEITETSVIRQNGQEIPTDIIIAATGFQVAKLFFPMEVIGQDGLAISQDPAHNCYYGTLYPGFPNFGTLVGVNTATGHSSVIYTTECQVNYLIRILKPVLKGHTASVAVTSEAQKRDYAWIRREMKKTVWESGKTVRGWYNDEQGRNTTLYPKSQIHFWLRSVFPRYQDLIYREEKPGSKLQRLAQIPVVPSLALGAFAALTVSRRLQSRS